MADKKQSKITTFFNNLTALFGFRRNDSPDLKTTGLDQSPTIDLGGKQSKLDFVKVDMDSVGRVAQAKIGRILKTPLSDKLNKLVNAWMNETYDTYQELSERFKRLAELEFAIMNDPFLGMVVDLSADEATQIDVSDQLIKVECSNPEMKKRMYQLLDQWGITQNRVRAVMYSLAGYADAFWSCKITTKGVERINPIKIRQVIDRLEFNPIEVAVKLQARKANNVLTYVVNRDKRVQTMLQILDEETPDTLADLFDYKLFGFVLTDEIVVPPWNIVHFRLTPEQSEFYPWGKPYLLKAIAPFKQANATMILQGLARIASFPITVYEVHVSPGMDETQQFEAINEVREEYDNLGVENTSGEVYSVNTKLWIPKDLITITVHSPNIDTSTIGDLELLQDRVVVASGVPKGFLVQEWGGFGNSGISLVQQHKPFARRVFTYQSAFLEGLNNLFRIHFAITGEFDYREPFVLSMNFPNEEMTDSKIATQRSTLELAKMIMDMLRELIASVDDPLPIEVIRDIMAKFSFLTPIDLRSWIKASYMKSTAGQAAMGGDMGMGGGLGGGFDMGGGLGGMSPSPMGSDSAGLGGLQPPPGGDLGGLGGMETGPTGAALGAGGGISDLTAMENKYSTMVRQRLTESRIQELNYRYEEIKDKLFVETLKTLRIDECVSNARHIRLCEVDQTSDLMLRALAKSSPESVKKLRENSKNDGEKEKKPVPEKTMDELSESFSRRLNVLGNIKEANGRVKEQFGIPDREYRES
jgi:hypothetical protein